ncbi:MAG: HD domain-containing protein, partial [Acidimicrobiales bacterium]
AARLAVQIFDRTDDVHELDELARELLGVAALVHNVGMFIAHSGHHKHAYYVIRHSEELVGFSQHEIELIALVARYHRKSHPSSKHPEFASLSETDQRTVRILAGILRVAIGLDRRHAGLVSAVGVRVESDDDDHDVLLIEPVVPTGADIGVELFAADARSELLASALDCMVEIRSRSLASGPISS